MSEELFPGLAREAGGPGPFRGSEEAFPGVTVTQGDPGPFRGSQGTDGKAEAKRKPVAAKTRGTSHREEEKLNRGAGGSPSEPEPPRMRSRRTKEGPKLSLRARRILRRTNSSSPRDVPGHQRSLAFWTFFQEREELQLRQPSLEFGPSASIWSTDLPKTSRRKGFREGLKRPSGQGVSLQWGEACLFVIQHGDNTTGEKC